jgi:hypothetical protein
MSIGAPGALRGGLSASLCMALLVGLGSVASAQSPASASASPEVPTASPSAAPTPCLFVATPAPDGSSPADPDTCLTTDSGFAWQEATLPGPSTGVWPIDGMAANGGGDVVLLGQTAGRNGKPLAWHSLDGLAWDAVKLSWPKGMGPIAVATVGNDFLAIGGGKTGTATASSGAGARWTVKKSAIPGATTLYGITSTNDGAAVVGASGKTAAPTIWSTRDGVKWSKASLLPAASEGLGSRPTLIAASPTGVMGAASRDSALWVAPDGITWQSAPLPATGEGTVVAALTGIPTGLLLVLDQGPAGGPVSSSIWVSADGLAWLPVHTTDGTALLHASSGPSGIVVQAEHMLLTSPDGMTWTEHPLTEFDSYVSTLAQTPGGRILVSGTTTDQANGALWMGTPPTP